MSNDSILDDILAGAMPAKEYKKAPYTFAKVKDRLGTIEYLVAKTEEEIEGYCDGGVLGYDKAIEKWYSNVTPSIVQEHFKWVGTRRNPFTVAKPIYINEAGEIDKFGVQRYVFKGYRNLK